MVVVGGGIYNKAFVGDAISLFSSFLDVNTVIVSRGVLHVLAERIENGKF